MSVIFVSHAVHPNNQVERRKLDQFVDHLEDCGWIVHEYFRFNRSIGYDCFLGILSALEVCAEAIVILDCRARHSKWVREEQSILFQRAAAGQCIIHVLETIPQPGAVPWVGLSSSGLQRQGRTESQVFRKEFVQAFRDPRAIPVRDEDALKHIRLVTAIGIIAPKLDRIWRALPETVRAALEEDLTGLIGWTPGVEPQRTELAIFLDALRSRMAHAIGISVQPPLSPQPGFIRVLSERLYFDPQILTEMARSKGRQKKYWTSEFDSRRSTIADIFFEISRHCVDCGATPDLLGLGQWLQTSFVSAHECAPIAAQLTSRIDCPAPHPRIFRVTNAFAKQIVTQAVSAIAGVRRALSIDYHPPARQMPDMPADLLAEIRMKFALGRDIGDRHVLERLRVMARHVQPTFCFMSVDGETRMESITRAHEKMPDVYFIVIDIEKIIDHATLPDLRLSGDYRDQEYYFETFEEILCSVAERTRI